MSTRHQVAWSLAALAFAVVACSAPPKPAPPEAPPVITSFTVDRAIISKGESVSFSFTTQRATKAELIDQDGATIPVAFDAAAGTGTATATPSASSFFILHADGAGGRDSAFVQVAVNADLQTVFLVVTPKEIHAGQSVDVVWAAANGKNVSVRAGQRVLSTEASGTLTDAPALSTTYTLTAEQADGTPLTTSVDVTVIPVVASFTATPPVAAAGEDITLAWQTAGGERVVLAEASFGQLLDDTSNVATGSYTFTVPATLDGGAGPIAVRDGFPLRFTLTLSTTAPAQAVTRAIDGRVGRGPGIDAFDVPASGTKDKPLTLSWQTTNATRVELYADGLLLFAPLAGRELDASFTVPPLVADTEFTLVAYDFNGLSVRQAKTARAVPPPTITTFTVPATVPVAGAPVAATWQTANATRVTIREKHGANLYFSDVPGEVAGATREVRIGATTTLVLEAANAAGDVATAERTTTVTSPVGVTFSPTPAGAYAPLTASWDVSSLGPVDLLGLANPTPQVAQGSTRFVDLDTVPQATALRFPNPDNATVTFTAPQGFVFPFVTSRVTRLGVSTNGVLVLGDGSVGNANENIGSANYTGVPLLAPFWDDLDLGARGTVKYFLDGAQFPRRLIVQWTKLERPASLNSELTFQVQLFETGQFLFLYKTMIGGDTDSATLGAVESPATFAAAYGFNTGGLALAGQETAWFSNDITRAAGTQALTVPSARPFGFFVQRANDELVAVSGVAKVFTASSVQLTEAMPVTSPTLSRGQWIELYNPTKETIDLTGLELAATADGGTPYAFQGLSIDAGAYLVLGQSTNATDNDGAGVSVAWSTGQLTMQPADRLELRIPGATPFVVSSLAWADQPVDGGWSSAAGKSVQPPLRTWENGDAPRACNRTLTFGQAAQVGTPGARNEFCFFYQLEQIPSEFVDISAFGTPIFTPGTDMNNVLASGIELPAPLTYYGQRYTRAWIHSDGWISVLPKTGPFGGNPWLTSVTNSPQGVIAVFWDDLANRDATPGANVYLARVGSATIVQWHRWSCFRAASFGGSTDDMTFEAKFFDDGVIEFHYATLVPSVPATPYALGIGATIWLERPWYAETIAVLRNATSFATNPRIAPNTAYRFTPAP